MAIQYRRTAQGSNYDALNAPDNSDKLREQADAYIDSLKRRRQQEAMQQTAFVEGMRRKMAAETQSLEAFSQNSINQMNAYAQLNAKREENEIRRDQLARQAAAGKPNAGVEVLKFIANIAPKAINAFAEADAQNRKENWEKGQQLGYLIPPTDTIALQQNLTNAEIMSAEQDKLAAIMRASGAPENVVADIENANQAKLSGIRHTMAKGLGQGAYTAFQRELTNPNTQFGVNINGQDYSLSQLPDQSVATQQSAYMQFLPKYFGVNDFGDVSPEFLSEGMQIARADGDRAFGRMQQAEYDARRGDILGQERQAFKINVRDTNTAEAAIEKIYTIEYQASQSHTTANAKLKDYLSDPNIVPQNIFDELGASMTLPGRPKPYALDRPADWEEIKQKRQQAINTKVGIENTAKMNAAAQEAVQLRQMIAQDMEGDGEINITDEQYKQIYAEAAADGLPNDPRIAVLNSNEKYISSSVQQAEQLERFKFLAEKGGLTEGMVFRSSLDPEQKSALYKQIKSGSIVSIDKDTNRRAEKYIKGRLTERTGDSGYIPNTSDTKAYVNRAVDFALQKFQRDYVNFARGTDGQNPYEAAIGLFEAEMQNQNGIYTVYSDDDVTKNNVDAKLKGTFKNGDFKIDANYETSQAPEVLVADAFQKYGDKAISTPNIMPKSILENINDDIQLGRRGVIPPVIEIMADRYNTDPLTVLEQQFKANGIEYDESYFKPAKEAVASVNPIWTTYLNNKPQIETTDAALIGSGQQPIYQTMPQAGQEVKRIVMSRESPVEGYNAMNNGTGGDRPGGARKYFGKDFKDMTLNEVLQLQQSGQLWAAGAYQFVPNTLPEAMDLAGVTGDVKFTPEVQDALFWATFDKYGASKWEPYWSNKATQNELNIMENFRRNYDYSKPTWRQSNNMNPQLVYRIGSLGYGSTGPHLDVKPVAIDSVYGDSSQTYTEGDLDKFVKVKSNGKLVPLSQGTVTTADDAAHRARGSYGHDYATPDGSSGQEVYLTNGAKVIENWVDPSANAEGSNRMVIELPNGKRYAFVHGTGVTNE